MQKILLTEIKCFYGEERFLELDRKYIDSLLEQDYPPILIDINNYIIDGHHRYIATQRKGEKEIAVIKLNVEFKDTDIYRDFDKHLKGMIPKDFTRQDLHEEFKRVIAWLFEKGVLWKQNSV